MNSTFSVDIISRRQDQSAFPLSVAQERLWFINQLEPANPVYNCPLVLRLTGSLNVTILRQALSEILHRHEVLRAAFPAMGGFPIQVINPAQSIHLPVNDLSKYSSTERASQVARLVNEEVQQPFDLDQGPLLRAILLRLGREEHMLLLVIHQIAFDGWSSGVLMKELAALYHAYSKGEDLSLPELPIQYVDFAAWQREWLQSQECETQFSYWRTQLDGIPPVLELPTDQPRLPKQMFRSEMQSLTLSNALGQALKELSRREGVTLFMTLLAAFKVLLYRYTGQEDIVVGSPAVERSRAETEGVIGCFANMLVLRSDLSGAPTFKELLTRVHDVALGAYAHQDLPFEKLVEELHPERDLSHTPLFQVFFNMTNVGDIELYLHELKTEPLSSFELEPKFDLTLYINESSATIQADFVYNAELFSPERIKCLSEQFCYLLEQITEAPEKPIRFYSLVTPEAQPLLPTPMVMLEEPSQELVTQMFAFWAKNTPQQAAVSQGELSWSYKELFACAGSVATVLCENGVNTGDVIAIYGQRCFGLIASILGTLLSGGVLLLIDPNLPHQRQKLMWQEAGPHTLIYLGNGCFEKPNFGEDSFSLVRIAPNTGLPIREEGALNREIIDLPYLGPDDASYIFFTSGTTGFPKGVLGGHKGLSHFLHWQRETFAITPQDRSAQLTALSFDVVLRDILLPLVSGATLCLPEHPEDLGPDEVVAWLERERITMLHTVPTVAQFWLNNASRVFSLPAMRRVFFAGEPLMDSLVHQSRTVFPNSDFVNLYGPTETTLAKCYYQVPDDPLPGIQPIGWPIPQTQVLILSESNQLCGVGEPGEIVLRTPFRTLGYINASEEDKKRFARNPFTEDIHDLLYYTGDRGRYRPDGSVEILGRLDFQVKIRGIRVEPDGINAILVQHPAVSSSIVSAMKDGQGQNFLVAYVVASKHKDLTISELRSYLHQQFPQAIVPSTFVFLEELPQSPNGKVDRRALPLPDQTHPELKETFVAPRTAVEKTLAAIWGNVLNVEQVGLYDNFFELGGHSLLATQVVSRIRKMLQIELPIRDIFDTPTIAGLSQVIEKEKLADNKNYSSGIPALSRSRYRVKISSGEE